MNRSIAHGICNLGKIQALVPYELLRRIDFHMGEIIDDAAAVAFTEKLLQLRASHQVVLADLFNRDLGIKILIQIIHNAFV